MLRCVVYLTLSTMLLLLQVRWEGCLTALLSTGHSRLYELGPGQQIKSMVRRIDNSAWKAFANVSA